MKQYLKLLDDVYKNGVDSTDRTGVGTRRIFGAQMRFNLAEGFPLLTTKKIHTKSIIHELLWFLQGDTNIKYLVDNNVHIWTDWCLNDYNARRSLGGLSPVTLQEFEDEIKRCETFAQNFGDLGLVYGKQWRQWGTPHEYIDQISDAINLLKTKPDDRGIIVTAWNPADVKNVKLRWCHCLFQFVVIDNKLSCQLYQRSADLFLGVPFNIASYAMLTQMFAEQCGFELGDFVWTGGDVHIYKNHFDQVEEQLSREPLKLPKLDIVRKPDSIFGYEYEDFDIIDYHHYAAIKAPVAV